MVVLHVALADASTKARLRCKRWIRVEGGSLGLRFASGLNPVRPAGMLPGRKPGPYDRSCWANKWLAPGLTGGLFASVVFLESIVCGLRRWERLYA